LFSHLSRHDSIAAGEIETFLDVLVVEDVSVGEDRDLNGLLDSSNLLPIGESLRFEEKKEERVSFGPSLLTIRSEIVSRCTHSLVPLHLPRPSVTSQDLSSSSFEQERVLDRLLGGVEDSELGCYGDVEVDVEDVDCEGRHNNRQLRATRKRNRREERRVVRQRDAEEASEDGRETKEGSD